MEQDKRIPLRLATKEREQIDRLVEIRKFRSLSQVVRLAIKEFLEEA